MNHALLEYGDEGTGPVAARRATGKAVTWMSTRAPSAVIQKLERFGPLTDEYRTLLAELVASEREVPAKVDLIREGAIRPTCMW